MGRSTDDEQMRLEAYTKRKFCAFFYFKEYGTHVEKSNHKRSDSEGAGLFAMTLLEDGLRGSLVRFYYKCAFV